MGTKDALGDIVDKDTGWSFSAMLDDPGAGYIVQALKHDEICFLFDLAVERVLVSRHPKATSPNVLAIALTPTDAAGKPKVKRTSGPTLSRPKKKTDPLGYYAAKLAINLTYEITELWGEANQKLVIEQELLFTPYGKDPSHEPSSALSAARVYPLVRFRVEPVTGDAPLSDPMNRICAVQAIYRMELSIGEELAFNFAGIFHDLDRAGGTAWSGLTYLFSGIANTVFDRAEKPVFYEVVGKGVTRSQPADWDNVHAWWPSLYSSTKGMGPTPGLPFGIHTHWRWGETYYDGSWILDGGSQYGGVYGAGSPILDPNLVDQSIEFAITNDWMFSSAIAGLKIDKDPDGVFADLSALMTATRAKPEATYNPDFNYKTNTILLWKAFTAYSPDYDLAKPKVAKGSGKKDIVMKELAGVFFVHGMFCPHESSDVLGTLPMNAYDAQIEPMPKDLKKHLAKLRRWRRP